MPPESPTLRQWWPATQSLDLVEGPVAAVADAAAAVFAAIARYSGDVHSAHWRRFARLDAAFASVPWFDNVGSRMLVLPTRSQWAVLWSNNFLCGGNDRFCAALTGEHGLATLHWSAHDATTTFQPGAMFHHRRRTPAGLVERRVQAARTDRRWDFFAQGAALPEEDVDGYRARKKRDRLNETRLMALLDRLGAAPWDEAFYALPEQPAFCLSRPLPETALRRARVAVIAGPVESA